MGDRKTSTIPGTRAYKTLSRKPCGKSAIDAGENKIFARPIRDADARYSQPLSNAASTIRMRYLLSFHLILRLIIKRLS